MIFEDAFFDTNNYELTDQKLGEGSFGKVYVVQNIEDEKKYAAKIINTKGVFNGHDQMMLMREFMILHDLDHPSIVKFHGINFHSFFDSSKLEPTILTEFLPNGSLKEILDKEKKCIADGNWSPAKKYICLLGISDAMRYLHAKGILHRDLKPQNILIDANFYPRICDFGLSRCFSFSLSNSIQLMMTGKIGTPLYMAPELFDDEDKYGPGVDVYAFAFLAYEIVTGMEPFNENGKSPSLKNLITKVMSGKRPAFPECIPEKMKDLISRCWSHDAKERPSFDEIFKLLSNDFSYFDETVDEDEVNEYLEILQEQKMDTKYNKIDQSKEKLDSFISSNDELILALNSIFDDKSECNSIQIINFLKKSSEKGNCYASYILGLLYENGKFVDKSFSNARKYYEKSSEQGNSHGFNRIGSLLKKDQTEAVKYFQKAADLGNLYAMLSLGIQYCNESNNFEKALELFQKVADQKIALGINCIGNLYYNGTGVDQNFVKALEYFKEAAELELPDAFASLGQIYLEGKGVDKNESKAIEYFQRAGELGHNGSLYKLGMLHIKDGYVDEKNVQKGIEYLEKAGKNGYSEAYLELGKIYSEDLIIRQDERKTLEYYQKAADLNNPKANNIIGFFYEKGKIVFQDYSKPNNIYDPFDIQIFKSNPIIIQDYSKAYDYYEKALNLGHLDSINNIGNLHLNGLGVPMDSSVALKKFEFAVEQMVLLILD